MPWSMLLRKEKLLPDPLTEKCDAQISKQKEMSLYVQELSLSLGLPIKL